MLHRQSVGHPEGECGSHAFNFLYVKATEHKLIRNTKKELDSYILTVLD